MYFSDLTRVASKFWKKMIARYISSKRPRFILQDPTGAIWPSTAHVQSELSEHRRLVDHTPRLIMSYVGKKRLRANDLTLQKNDSHKQDSSVDDVRASGGEGEGTRITNVIYILELIGLILFIAISLATMELMLLPASSTYSAEKYVRDNLVDTEWQRCVDVSEFRVMRAYQGGASTTRCRTTSFATVTDVYQMFDWAKGIWLFNFGKTVSKVGTFDDLPTVSNYQVVGDTYQVFDLRIPTGSQIIGDTLIWTVRETNIYDDFDTPSSSAFGNCSNSSGAVCWGYKSGGFPTVSGYSNFDRTYNGDGFVISMPSNSNKTVWDATLYQMETSGFVDAKTRAIGFTVNLWTESAGLLFSPNLIFEFSNTGAIATTHRTEMFKSIGLSNTRTLLLVGTIACLATLIAPLYVISEYVYMTFRGIRSANKRSDKTLLPPGFACNSDFFRYHYKLSVEPAILTAIRLLRSFLLFHVAFVITYMLVVVYTIEYTQMLDDVKDSLRYTQTGYIDVYDVQVLYRRLRVVRGMSILFALLKSTYFLSNISAATRLLIDTIVESFSKIVIAIMMLIVCRFALIAYAMSLYGQRTDEYSTISYSLVSMNFFLLGEPVYGETAFGTRFRLFEAIFLIMFVVLEYYTFFTLLIVVLTYFYKKNHQRRERRMRTSKRVKKAAGEGNKGIESDGDGSSRKGG